MSAISHAVQPKIEIFEQFDDLRMVAFLSMKDIDNSPEWNPGLTPPPLTVGEAIQAVKSSFKIGDIKEIELRLVPKYEKKWHYLIKTTNEAMKSKFSTYVVLMNGVIVPAIIEPQGYK
jgi:hypothetical protein